MKLGKRKCKNCKVVFQKERPLQFVCSPKCGYEYQKKLNDKKERKELAQKKKDLMTRGEWVKLLQKTFNTYIKLRDKDKPCISCGKPAESKIKWDAGHYWPTTYQFLRVHEDNVHKQCSYDCNMNKHGNTAEYRIRLIERIGEDKVQWLDDNRHTEWSVTIPEIQELIALYKQKIKTLKQ